MCERLLERPRRHDDTPRTNHIVRECHLEAAVVHPKLCHLGAADRGFNPLRVRGECRDDVRERRERVRRPGRIHPRELRAPVGRVQTEGVPTRASPRFGNAAAFEDDVGHAKPAQVIARRQPCLTGTDDDGVEHRPRFWRPITYVHNLGCAGVPQLRLRAYASMRSTSVSGTTPS